MMNINPQEIAVLVNNSRSAVPDVLQVKCPSTNTYAKGISVSKDTIYISPEQSEGRGRNGKKFLSNLGGIYMTIVLFRSIDYKILPHYPLICGLAVRTALLRQGIKSDLKWPNDVKVLGKKLCGILAECDAATSSILLGVGLNVENDLGEFKDIAVSTKELGINVDANKLIADIYVQILCLEKEKFSDVLSSYRTACITVGSFLPGYGKAVGIDENGFLTYLDGSGNLKTLYNPIE